MELPLKNKYVELLNMSNQDIYENVTEVFLKGIMVN
jgi:hypothetical protein